jgi:ssDNA-binding Zn-finger/Zn-ribbon topoisomerase 1
VLNRLGKVLTTFALICVIGGHWAALQGLAWTTMIAENLRTDSIGDALSKTFDGQHPCPICRQIAAAKKSEKKSEFSTSLKKLEFIGKDAAFVLSAPTHFTLLPTETPTMRELAHKPPTPPPRSV